jgi:hypothetical protein
MLLAVAAAQSREGIQLLALVSMIGTSIVHHKGKCLLWIII